MTYKFDEAKADRPIRFIEEFCKGTPDEPFHLLDFQQEEIIRPMWGWVDQSGNLKHRFCYVEMPKGNGKSGLLARLALYGLVGMGIKQAEVYVCAADKDQAKIIYNDCVKVVEEDYRLQSACKIYKSAGVIVHEKTGSRLKALSSEAFTKHGLRPSFVIFDEMAVQPNSELYDVVTQGLMKRDNALCFMLTTAGYKNTYGELVSNYAKNIHNGITKSDYWHTVFYAADPDCDPFDETVWEAVNPSWGTLIKRDNFLPLVEKARTMPSNLAAFKRLHLNIWTGINEDWVSSTEWDNCTGHGLTDDQLERATWYGGFDGSKKRDLTAFALVAKIGSVVAVKAWHWLPMDQVEERIRLEQPYMGEWADEGHIHATPGNVQDVEQIADDILEIMKTHKVQGFYYDPKYALELVKKLEEERVECYGVRQGALSLGMPTAELEGLIVGGKLEHFGNPVLRWQISNVQIERDRNDNYLISKGRSRDRIDGIAAIINALFGMMNDDGNTSGPPDDWSPTFL